VSGGGFTASVASLPEPALDRVGSDGQIRSSTVTFSSPTRPVAPSERSPVDMSLAVARLRAHVQSLPSVDERESLSKAIMMSELDRLDRPFDETADSTHVTASAIVTSRRGVILHRHRRLHRWMQPGGHLEPGEVPQEAVIRECVEETGLAVAHPPDGAILVHVDVHRAAKGHVHLDLRYLLWAPDADPSPAPGESQDVAWFTWEAADDLADEALAGALVSARSLIEASRIRMTGRE
jgi:8-oxo-dGTP pyrophosphatase MutT (NUDIX family)